MKRNKLARLNRFVFPLVFWAGWLLGAAAEESDRAANSASIEVRIDGARPLQQIDGFGSSCVVGFEALERGAFDQVVPYGVAYRTAPEQRKAILETAIRELGATHLRLWLWPPGIEPRNDNDDPRVMDWSAFHWRGASGEPQAKNMVENRANGIHEWGELLTNALPLGLTHWILTPGDMPEWLHQRLNDSKDAERFEEYAEWAAAHLLYLKKNFGLEAPYCSLCKNRSSFFQKSLFLDPDGFGKLSSGSSWKRKFLSVSKLPPACFKGSIGRSTSMRECSRYCLSSFSA